MRLTIDECNRLLEVLAADDAGLHPHHSKVIANQRLRAKIIRERQVAQNQHNPALPLELPTAQQDDDG